MMIDIMVGAGWQSVNTLSGSPVGNNIIVQNKSNDWVLLYEGDQPASGSTTGVIITDLNGGEASKQFPVGSGEIWCKMLNGIRTSKLNVQDLGSGE